MNYDGSKVGVPYSRVVRFWVDYPDDGPPMLTVEQAMEVKLADGTVWARDKLPQINSVVDFTKADQPIPLVHPETSESIGQDTNLQQVFMNVLAYIRYVQREADKAADAAK